MSSAFRSAHLAGLIVAAEIVFARAKGRVAFQALCGLKTYGRLKRPPVALGVDANSQRRVSVADAPPQECV